MHNEHCHYKGPKNTEHICKKKNKEKELHEYKSHDSLAWCSQDDLSQSIHMWFMKTESFFFFSLYKKDHNFSFKKIFVSSRKGVHMFEV